MLREIASKQQRTMKSLFPYYRSWLYHWFHTQYNVDNIKSRNSGLTFLVHLVELFWLIVAMLIIVVDVVMSCLVKSCNCFMQIFHGAVKWNLLTAA